MTYSCPEEYRVTHPQMGIGDHENGLFCVPTVKTQPDNYYLQIIASKGDGWEHVSCVLVRGGTHTTPSWENMCKVKDLFWTKDDTVIQIHPPESEYVNFHPNCLHLWRAIDASYDLPPTYMIGPKQ